MKNSYIRFINLLDALDRMNPSRSLDKIEISLLEHILSIKSQNGVVLVGDLLQLKRLGSQATLHGRVKNLSALGYIKLVIDTKDGRKKSVVPTKLSLNYIQFMSECLETSVKV